MTQTPPSPLQASRRDFLKASTGTALGASLATAPVLAHGVHVLGDEKLKVGLIGCGGRGTGAAANALRASEDNVLFAMADVFADKIQSSRARLRKNAVGAQVLVDDEHCFTGFDAYKKVVDCVDVVILTCSPHFRPEHLAYAIAQGKHVFCEKPVAVDAPGIRSVIETCKKAKEKNLAIVSGLCYRYHRPKLELYKRIHAGAIGEIRTLQATYHGGGLWHRGSKPKWSNMEYMIRNWVYFAWLAGDMIAEQHIHSLDKVAWAMQDKYPIAVTACGGRTQRTGHKYGNVYDHFSTVYDFEGGVKAFCSCRQWNGCTNDVSDYAYGTKGVAALQGHWIKGENAWRFKGKGGNMYDDEHVALFRSIRNGRPINNGEYMWKSTLMAIMGRMSAYTGKRVTWDMALNSKDKLGPDRYEWNDQFNARPIAVPGVTKFV